MILLVPNYQILISIEWSLELETKKIINRDILVSLNCFILTSIDFISYIVKIHLGYYSELITLTVPSSVL